MGSKIIEYGGLSIYTEHYGIEKCTPILLIMGATAQGVMWDTAFCEALANNGLFVIRYDHRDTGKSSRVVYEEHPYYLSDLTSDAIAILDAYNVEKAIFCGASMGSFIAQNAAINYRAKVLALICIMSSPNHLVFIEGFEGRDTYHLGLPASDPNILKYYQTILDVKAETPEDAHNQYLAALKGIISVPEHLEEVRVFEGRILKRLKSKHHIHNHAFALAKSCDLHKSLHTIKQPTLILHGLEDSILPVEHGRALHHIISQSEYVEIQEMGHCFTPSIFAKVCAEVTDFAGKLS
ncbi:MAG: alpha/beta fold hydrolase [Alphaproteobacteria bacterium]|jgi:pimeloyl-ACP methyl ester carboxylesterase|nr:alpha/beta fold hydrolase [Candidatus Jidaibacter sp.]